MRRILFLLILTVAASIHAQTEVSKFISGTKEGVTYYLPDTEIEIILEATCIKKTPGEFSRYAERYLRAKEAIKEAGSYWELTGAAIRTTGKPSAEKMYTVKPNGNISSNITLDGQGIIMAINATLPATKKTASPIAPETGGRGDASQYMTEEMLQASSTAKLAELTAKEIYAIRESKLAITRGQSENMPKDGEALKLMLDELDKQERVLTEMFIGHADTLRQEMRITIAANEICDTTKAVLLRFSHKLGFVSKDNLAGEPIYYNFRDLKSVKLPTEEELKKMKPIKKEGICYNIPGRAEVEVYTRTRKLAKSEISIAQLGTTEVLSKTLFNKNSTTKVIFDTATGGITSIEN